MTAPAKRLLFFAATFFCDCGPGKQSQIWTNDAYVWQRRWNQGVRDALRSSAADIQEFRVLAAEVDTRAQMTKIVVDRQALREVNQPVIAVVRIDGHNDIAALTPNLTNEIAAIAHGWTRGIEIDYDCPTARLPSYRSFLRLLRKRLPSDLTLSITALPSWMGSEETPQLLAEVDESVLQVHSVMSPKRGLFDRSTAYRWTRDWSKISARPFRVALPTYWSRVTWTSVGRVTAIESEVNRYGDDGDGRELVVAPSEVSSLVAELRKARVRNLTGIAWFRLPTADDRRAWSQRTWNAVMRGEALHESKTVVHFTRTRNGADDVSLRNEGEVDVKLPQQVSLSGQTCEAADALPPYDLVRNDSGLSFVSRGDDLLRSGRERTIGWIRCSEGGLESRVIR